MVRSIGPDNQLSGHKGVQIAACLGASESELSRFLDREFYFRYLVPVRLEGSVIILPGVFEIVDPLLLDDKLDGVTVHEKSVGHVTGSRFQDNGIPLVHHYSRGGISIFARGERNPMGLRLMGQETDPNGYQNRQSES